MKHLKTLGVGLMAVVLSAGQAAVAATDLVSNGSFDSVSGCGPLGLVCGSATGWTDNNVNFAGNDGRFFGTNDSLFQNLGSSITGTTLNVSFDFDKLPIVGGAGYLTYTLLSYADAGYSIGATALSTGTFGSGDADGTKTFNSIVVGSNSFVRIYFDSISLRRFAIDNVSVLATAPVPEPSTYALMFAGLSAIAFIARRRRPNRD